MEEMFDSARAAMASSSSESGITREAFGQAAISDMREFRRSVESNMETNTASGTGSQQGSARAAMDGNASSDAVSSTSGRSPKRIQVGWIRR